MTDELKKALEATVTVEQKKAVAEKFKEEISKLSEEELDKIAGGRRLIICNRRIMGYDGVRIVETED